MINICAGGSFRDPSGVVFYRGPFVFRQINTSYKEHYDFLMGSGLYDQLVKDRLLVSHEEVETIPFDESNVYKVIRPQMLPFISYPYEWCFSQLKDAALTLLRIQKIALSYGMSLKDATAYNVQFFDGKPILIDTLSFERHQEGQPWVPYRQFCQHFLAPLALMSYKDVRLNQLLRVYIDGVPLDLASALLPIKTYFSFFLFSHIHLHSRFQQHFAERSVNACTKMSRWALLGLIDNLESAIKKLKWRPFNAPRAVYDEFISYSSVALKHKKQLVADFLAGLVSGTVWDFGANCGTFSQIASEQGMPVISFDINPSAVEKNYCNCLRNQRSGILPLLFDLINPSPGIGWENEERVSLFERGSATIALALALIHHLTISHNVPFSKIARFFQRTCNYLIIEFIPKDDLQVQNMLRNRNDIFAGYNREAFEKNFNQYFIICEAKKIEDSRRILFLMEKRRA